MRDVYNGWFVRYMHSNTASFFFFLVVYIFYFCFYFIIFNFNYKFEFINKEVRNYSSKVDNFTIITSNSSCISQKNSFPRARGESSPPPPEGLDILSDEDFFEWFRGFIDAEGCFLIQKIGNYFKLTFSICLHQDETILLEYLKKRLGVGYITYSTSKKKIQFLILYLVKMIYLKFLVFLTKNLWILEKIWII